MMHVLSKTTVMRKRSPWRTETPPKRPLLLYLPPFLSSASLLMLPSFLSIRTAAGDAYDEESMEVGEVVVGEADGVVVEVEQKGYQIGERVARRARVKVSATEATLQKAKEEEKEEEGDSEAKEDSGQE